MFYPKLIVSTSTQAVNKVFSETLNFTGPVTIEEIRVGDLVNSLKTQTNLAVS